MSDQTSQPPEPGQQPDAEAATSAGDHPFLQAVRRVAGWRVSPRQLAAALEAIAESDEEATPERVAEIVSASRGEPSSRQRRHGELWRTLGAQLIVHGLPGDPTAQRAFIGQARAAARREVSDPLLINVALELAAEGRPLDPKLVGNVARLVRRRLGAGAAPDEISQAIPDALRELRAKRRAPSIRGGRTDLPRSPVKTRRGTAGRGPRRR